MKMNRQQVIDEIETLIEGFNKEFEACPICLMEAVRILKEDGRCSDGLHSEDATK